MRFLSLILACLCLAGCQTPLPPPKVEDSRTYDSDAATIWTATVQAVNAEGLSIIESDRESGRLLASRVDYAARDWALCRPARVIDRHDDKNRRSRGRPVDRQLQLLAEMTDQGDSTAVTLHASFTERQINPFKNLPFRVACRSTGTLERTLLDAIQRR